MAFINTTPIHVSAQQLVERASIIVVVDKTSLEERLMTQSSTLRGKHYVQQYIVQKSLRGPYLPNDSIRVIAPHSALRILLEEGTNVSMKRNLFVYQAEENNLVPPSKKEILFLIETQDATIHNYAFEGLKLNDTSLGTIQKIIQSQPTPFQRKYTTVFYEDVPIDLRELDKEATHILLVKERIPHIVIQENQSIKRTNILGGFPALAPTATSITQSEIHHYEVLQSIRGPYQKGEHIEIAFDESLSDELLEQSERERRYAHLQKKRYLLVDEHKKQYFSSEEKTFFLLLRNIRTTDPSKEDTSITIEASKGLLEYVFGSYRVPNRFATEIEKMNFQQTLWSKFWKSICGLFR